MASRLSNFEVNEARPCKVPRNKIKISSRYLYFAWRSVLRRLQGKMESRVRKAEKLVERSMKVNDASHDASHVWRVRDLALSLAREEGLASNPDSMEIVLFL